jgi:hypothetical protein
MVDKPELLETDISPVRWRMAPWAPCCTLAVAFEV